MWLNWDITFYSGFVLAPLHFFLCFCLQVNLVALTLLHIWPMRDMPVLSSLLLFVLSNDCFPMLLEYFCISCGCNDKRYKSFWNFKVGVKLSCLILFKKDWILQSFKLQDTRLFQLDISILFLGALEIIARQCQFGH